MKLLNVGCGAVRPGDPWTNLDNLHNQLKPGTPERINLDVEQNYVNFDISAGSLPFNDDTFDGILLSHVIEHFDCFGAVTLLSECRRVLKPTTGIIVVSVPDAEYFLNVRDRDTRENAVELFGEPICPDEPWHKSFFDYALFYDQHKQILTESALRCLLIRAGFNPDSAKRNLTRHGECIHECIPFISAIMNRRKFSLEMTATK